MKQCFTCNIIKQLDDFTKCARNKDGYHYNCKDCRREYRKNNIEKTREYSRKYRKNNRDDINKRKRSARIKRIDHYKKMSSLTYQRNREKIREKQRLYYLKNRDAIAKKQRVYQTNKLKTDHKYKLICNLRTRMRRAIKDAKFIKSKSTLDILGADIDMVRKHIESQFEPWMSWENYGYHTWHIDHIIPLASATTIDELHKLCHYTNLQPLAAKDNIAKKAKVIVPPPRHAPE